VRTNHGGSGFSRSALRSGGVCTAHSRIEETQDVDLNGDRNREWSKTTLHRSLSKWAGCVHGYGYPVPLRISFRSKEEGGLGEDFRFLDFGRFYLITEQKLRPEVLIYLCFPFTHIVTWGQYDSSTDNTNLLGSISWNWHVHSCRTLNKNSTWVHHGTQAVSSWMRCAATIQSLLLMLQWHAIISLSIPVTSD